MSEQESYTPRVSQEEIIERLNVLRKEEAQREEKEREKAEREVEERFREITAVQERLFEKIEGGWIYASLEEIKKNQEKLNLTGREAFLEKKLFTEAEESGDGERRSELLLIDEQTARALEQALALPSTGRKSFLDKVRRDFPGAKADIFDLLLSGSIKKLKDFPGLELKNDTGTDWTDVELKSVRVSE